MSGDRRAARTPASAGAGIGEVVALLAARIDQLAPEMLPGGRREGAEWVCGGLDGSAGRSLSVRLTGDKAGIWSDFAMSGVGGDALDLIAETRFGGDKKQAWAWALSWLGLDGKDPARLKATRAAQATARQAADAAGPETSIDNSEREQASRRAFARWLEARGSLRGTPAADYLADRGLDLARLGRQPGALRFHPDLWDGRTGRKGPALVAVMSGGDGRPRGLHRTYLEQDDSGVWRRAHKRYLGPIRGAAIRLWRGSVVDPETGELTRAPAIGDCAEGSAELVVTEGVEDGLSIALADPVRRVWVAGDVGNIAALELPPAIGRVLVAAQNDPPDSPAAEAVRKAAAKLAERADVAIVHPPDAWKDWNDWVTGKAQARAGGAA